MLSPLLGEETEQEIVFKTRQTVLKMMEKRGYTVPKKMHISFQEFLQEYVFA